MWQLKFEGGEYSRSPSLQLLAQKAWLLPCHTIYHTSVSQPDVIRLSFITIAPIYRRLGVHGLHYHLCPTFIPGADGNATLFVLSSILPLSVYPGHVAHSTMCLSDQFMDIRHWTILWLPSVEKC